MENENGKFSKVQLQTSDDTNNNGKQQAKEYHGGDGKIEPEILLFYSNVTGQPAKPMQFVVKEVNDDADNH